MAAYSLGRLVSWGVLAKLASKFGRKVSLMCSALFLVIGALMWSSTLFIGGILMLFAAQFTLGFGSGSLGISRYECLTLSLFPLLDCFTIFFTSRAFIMGHTQIRNRIHVMTRLTSLQYAAATILPILSSIMIDTGSMFSPYWELTFPLFTFAFLALLSLGLLLYPFADPAPIYSFSSYNSHSQHHTHTQLYHPVRTNRSTAPAAAYDRIVASPIIQSTRVDSGRNKIGDSRDRSEEDDDFEDDDDDEQEAEDYDRHRPAKSMMFSTEAESEIVTEATSLYPGVEEVVPSIPSSRNSLCEIPLDDSVDEDPKVVQQTLSQRLLSALMEQGKTETATTLISAPMPPSPIDPHRKKVVWLTMLLNFTTRGAFSVMETQAAQTFLRQYGYSTLRLGAEVAVAGVMGTMQILFFKKLWSSHFTDYELILAGLFLLGMGQSLAVTWGPNPTDKPAWRFVIAYYLVVAIAYPVANTAVLGAFTSLQRTERRSKSHARFAIFGTVARIICPIVSGYLEAFVQEGASFGFVLIMIAVSIAAVMIVSPERLLTAVAVNPSLRSIQLDDAPSSKLCIGVKAMVCMACVFAIAATVGAVVNWKIPQ